MDTRVLRDTLEAVYVSSPDKFAHNVEAGRRSKDWLAYFVLPQSYHMLPFLAE